MTLYSGPTDIHSHRARIVLAEKGITYEVVNTGTGEFPEDLADLNPYASVPTLVDRDLVLYYARVIIEYLDERFPHPPLMPVDPVSRARSRLTLTRFEQEWYPLVEKVIAGGKGVEAARRELGETLAASAEVFAVKPFFLSDEFSLVDASIAPILWRLPGMGVNLPPEAAPLLEYGERMFERESFQKSLTDAEREMRS